MKAVELKKIVLEKYPKWIVSIKKSTRKSDIELFEVKIKKGFDLYKVSILNISQIKNL